MYVYSASQLGSCTKLLVAQRLGFDPTPGFGEDIPAFQQGHVIEQEVLEYLRAHNWNILATQREYLLPIAPDVAIQCHPDAIGTQMGSTDQYAIEIKSAAQDSYDTWVKKRWEAGDLWLRYLYQVSAYHHASQLPVAFVVRSKPKVSSDIPNTHISMYASAPPLLTLQQLRDRVMDIESRAEKYNIPDTCDCPTPDMFCPYAYLHESTREFEDNPDLERLAREYAEVVAEDNASKSRAKNVTMKRMRLRRKLLEAMGRDPDVDDGGESRTLDTGRVKVIATWGPVSRPYPNWQKIQEELGVDKKELQTPPKYGYRVRVLVRD